jgi:hypothetical protein
MFLAVLRRLFNIAHISCSGMGWAKLLIAMKGGWQAVSCRRDEVAAPDARGCPSSY